MSHFYGTVQGQAGLATRRGSKNSGLVVNAASFKGCISVALEVTKDGKDKFYIHQEPWHGAGIREHIVEGILGEPVQTSKRLKGHEGRKRRKFTQRQIDGILCALRYWQADGAPDLEQIATNDREGDDASLDLEEIDELCEAINMGEFE